MGNRRMQTKYLTVSAMLCAVGVLILALGSLIEVLDISVAVFASLLCVYAVIEIGGAYPWVIWAVTALLALLLLPQKTPSIFYVCFAGFYPILKEKFERRKPILCRILKLVTFHLCLGAIVWILWLFLPGTLELSSVSWLAAGLYAACLACFLLYDVALTRLISLYLIRLRPRFRIK